MKKKLIILLSLLGTMQAYAETTATRVQTPVVKTIQTGFRTVQMQLPQTNSWNLQNKLLVAGLVAGSIVGGYLCYKLLSGNQKLYHEGNLSDLWVSNDGATIISSATGIKIWHAGPDRWSCTQTIAAGITKGVSANSSLSTIASADENGNIAIWERADNKYENVFTGSIHQRFRTMPLQSGKGRMVPHIAGISLSEDGSALTVGDTSGCVTRLKRQVDGSWQRQTYKIYPEGIHGFWTSKDRKTIISTNRNSIKIRTYNEYAILQSTCSLPHKARELWVSENGRTILAKTDDSPCGDLTIVKQSNGNSWNVSKIKSCLDFHFDDSNAFCATEDGNIIFTHLINQKILAWKQNEQNQWQCIKTFDVGLNPGLLKINQQTKKLFVGDGWGDAAIKVLDIADLLTPQTTQQN